MAFNARLIAKYTKTFLAGDEPLIINMPPADGFRRFVLRGITRPKAFYLPDLAKDQNKLNSNENRSTIYWNPNIVSNHEGKAKVSFDAVGKTGKYQI